jgi:hypothetical protein
MSYTYSLKWETIQGRKAFKITVTRVHLSAVTCSHCGHLAPANEVLIYAREYTPSDPILFGGRVLKRVVHGAVLSSETCGLLIALARRDLGRPLSQFQLLPIALHLAEAEWAPVPGCDDGTVFSAVLATIETDGSIILGVSGKVP